MKNLEIVATSNANRYKEFITDNTGRIVRIFSACPVDMFVFETDGTIRCAGYNFDTDVLDETTVVGFAVGVPEEVIWFKIDDYGDRYVGTFLLPEDY
jgi:hypothetical protein